jgi:hypothetical protein
MKHGPIAENGDKCLVCSQGAINKTILDAIFLQGKELSCRYCGAIHACVIDEEGYKNLGVKGIRYIDNARRQA